MPKKDNVTYLHAWTRDKKAMDSGAVVQVQVMDGPEVKKVVRTIDFPQLFVVHYGEPMANNRMYEEKNIASLGYLDNGTHHAIIPMLMDCMFHLRGYESPDGVKGFQYYALRKQFIKYLNLGLEELGVPHIDDDATIVVRTEVVTYAHYDRDAVLDSKPEFTSLTPTEVKRSDKDTLH